MVNIIVVQTTFIHLHYRSQTLLFRSMPSYFFSTLVYDLYGMNFNILISVVIYSSAHTGLVSSVSVNASGNATCEPFHMKLKSRYHDILAFEHSFGFGHEFEAAQTWEGGHAIKTLLRT